MLKTLQCNKHTVYTGVSLICSRHSIIEKKSFVESADVYMRALTDGEISAYVKTGEPLDKAGAYGVQGKGSVLVERIEGDYYTVMGLPLARLCIAMKEMGVDVTEFWAQGDACR
jgi:septum formation protein